MSSSDPKVSERQKEFEAVRLAKQFHEAYERLAPKFKYETRLESAKPWLHIPEATRRLMTAVCREIIDTWPRAGLQEKLDQLNLGTSQCPRCDNGTYNGKPCSICDGRGTILPATPNESHLAEQNADLEENLAQAQAELTRVKADYVSVNQNFAELTRLRSQLQNSRAELEQAWTLAAGNPATEELKGLRSQLEEAQDELAKLKGPQNDRNACIARAETAEVANQRLVEALVDIGQDAIANIEPVVSHLLLNRSGIAAAVKRALHPTPSPAPEQFESRSQEKRVRTLGNEGK